MIVTKDDTTIVEGGGSAEDVKGRVAQIKRAIDDTDSDWDREKLQERLAKLAGGVAVVKVGAATEVELEEKKHRIEDALSATRAAVEEGIVAGGGRRCCAPASRSTSWRRRWTATRPPVPDCGPFAGGAVALDRLQCRSRGRRAGQPGRVGRGCLGLNAATGVIEDLVKAGIIDPAKVTRSALQNAASIAALLLATEALVADKPEKPGGRTPLPRLAMVGMGGMGGMGGMR